MTSSLSKAAISEPKRCTCMQGGASGKRVWVSASSTNAHRNVCSASRGGVDTFHHGGTRVVLHGTASTNGWTKGTVRRSSWRGIGRK